MTFLHKLAQRLSRMKAAFIVGAVVAIACEIPLPVDPSGSIARLLVSPKALTTRAGQMADFVVVGLTSNGDTASVPVTWSVTGGTMVDTSTSGGKHLGKYKAPMSPGRYKVVAQSGGVADSAVVDVSSVPVATVSVSPASASATVGQTVQLTATTRDSTGASLSGRIVTWASNNSAVATVSASGLVTGVAAGAATITATSEGKNGTAAVTMTPPPVASVIVSPAAVSAALGQTAQFTVRLEDASGNVLTGRAVSWTSGNTGVATVSGSGLVTPVAAGLAIITATSEGKNGTAGITVTLTPAVVASVSVSPASANVIAGQTLQLTATVRDASGNVLQGRVVTWASNDASLATVNGSGVVTGVDAGTATITATSEGQSGSAAVTVTVPVATLSVSPGSASVIAGQTVQLTATPRDANGNVLTGRVVTWASGNTARATVNGSGVVTGVNTGTVTITATSEGKSGTAALTVTPVPVATVTVSPATPSVSVGQMVQLMATPRDANGNPLTGRVITWSSSAAGTATVSGSGLVTGVAAGSATITATSEGQSGSATVNVTPPAPVATVSLSPATPSVSVGQTVQLTVTLRDVLGNPLTGRVVTWSSNALSVATVSVSGLVTGLVVGSATITATSEGQSGTAAVTVSSGGTFAPPNIASADFQNGTFGAFQNNEGSSIQIVDDPTGAGLGKVCRIQYSMNASVYHDDNNAGLEYPFNRGANVQDVYTRMYVYIADPGAAIEALLPQRKIIYVNPGQGTWTTTSARYFDGVSGPAPQYVGLRMLNVTGSPFIETQRSGFINWALNTWYYLEMRVKVNTPGQNDGIIQVWAGTMGAPGLANMLLVDMHNVNVRGSSTDPYLLITLGQQLDRFGNVSWTENRYLKNVALSTTRIGP